MAKHIMTRSLAIGLTAMLMVVGLFLIFHQQADAGNPSQETEAYCLSCHSNPDLSMTLPSGDVVPLYVNPDELKLSIHSPLGIECEACHTGIKIYPHPAISYQTQREMTRAYTQNCEKCHSAIYEKAQDSMHAQVAAERPEAPVCTDCHGSHEMHSPNEPRALISTTCSKCHGEIYEQYKTSIHGSALIGENNPDVPVCTDCHGVHNIQDPRTVQFRIESPELCASCHANAELMSKYGLPSDVYNIYKLSWHGVDVSVYKARWPTIWHDSAVCTDCHGVHDIQQTSNPQSRVNSTNLLATCQKCHPGVDPKWMQAWTGHNEISLERTPLLYTIDVFYSSLTPAVLWAAGIYVLLQIIRNIVDRARRNLR